MKRLTLAAALLLASTACALAQTNGAPGIPTPAVFPETGENSSGNSQIMSIARLKLGYCVATATGSGAAGGGQTATCNGAAGQITTVALTVATVGGINTLTVTDPKVLPGDMVQCTVDTTGMVAAALPICAGAQVTGGSVALILSNLLAVSPAAAIKVNFLVITGGNPH